MHIKGSRGIRGTYTFMLKHDTHTHTQARTHARTHLDVNVTPVLEPPRLDLQKEVEAIRGGCAGGNDVSRQQPIV